MATKTINLTGAEVAVTGLDGAHAHIRNDGTEVIYAAKTAGITAGADGVASIPAGQSDTIRGISGAVYLLGTGSVLIQSDDYVASPFKASATSGGSGADEVARAAINTHSGNAEIHVTAAEKTAWNGKAELTDIPTTLPANGGNADTLDGKHASDFKPYYSYAPIFTGNILDITEMGTYSCHISNCSNLPSGIYDWGYVTMYNFNNSGYKRFICTPLDALGDNYSGKPNGMIYLASESYKDADGNLIWSRACDGGNSAALESHPASDFVLKADYDALAARVAALEGGTT